MKKKLWFPILSLVVLLFVAAGSWYTRPRTLAQLAPYSLEQAQDVLITLRQQGDTYKGQWTADHPGWQELTGHISSAVYRRSLSDLLRGGRAADSGSLNGGIYLSLTFFNETEDAFILDLRDNQVIFSPAFRSSGQTYVPSPSSLKETLAEIIHSSR